MTKEYISIFLIMFWLAYPIPLMYMITPNYEKLDTKNVLNDINQEEPNLLTNAKTFFSGVKLYFKVMYLSIPNIPNYMSFIIVFLQLLSALFIFIMFRGN